jgi:flagellar biosynthesis component FlhA
MIKSAKPIIALSIVLAMMAAMAGQPPICILFVVNAFFWNMWLEEETERLKKLRKQQNDNELWERGE